MTGVKHRHPFRPRSLLSWPGVIAPVVVLVAGALIGAWLATRSTASASQYRLFPVSTTTLSQTLSTTGTIEPQTTANLSFSASGEVTAVDATVGQHVSDGQTLASMNSPSLQQQAAQAQATLDQDQSRLSQDEASGASSAQISADQATVAADQSQVSSANEALSGVTLVSPVNGVVTAVGYTAGEQLAGGGGGSGGADDSGGGGGSGGGGDSGGGGGSGSEMITVVSNSDVINASVDASQTSEIKAGDQATITTEGVNAPVTGRVASIGLIASISSGVATFPVVIDVTGSTSGLYAGASASVSVTYKEVANALVVPSAAVQPGPGGNSVVDVMVHGQQVPKNVTTGIVSGGLTQITSGLTAGEQAVVNTVTINPGSPGGGGQGVFIGPGGGVKVIGPAGGAAQVQGGG
jgi:membrane fusion protein, macrolide-specific efflux system